MLHVLPQTAKEITDYFRTSTDMPVNEMEILGSVVAEILLNGQQVNNKNIILKLLHRLELERDVVSIDVYRHVLELVVHRTPDDLSI